LPPKKRLRKELLVEGPSQVAGTQVFKTIQKATQPQTSTEHLPAAVEIRRPEQPPEQPMTQTKLLATNTSAPSTQRPHQRQETKTQEDQQQELVEVIEAIIKDQLVHLRQENDCLQLYAGATGQKKSDDEKSS
jgi:hypothetical protein